MKEKWKKIDGYPDYSAGSLGNIYQHGKNRILPQYEGGCVERNIRRHLYVNLYKDKKNHTKRLCRLIAKAFCENPESKQQVNHIDGNPKNNSADNLEWVTPSENIKHAYAIGLTKSSIQEGQKHPKAKLHDQDVIRIRSLAGEITQVNIGKMYNVSRECIASIIQRKSWRHL